MSGKESYAAMVGKSLAEAMATEKQSQTKDKPLLGYVRPCIAINFPERKVHLKYQHIETGKWLFSQELDVPVLNDEIEIVLEAIVEVTLGNA